MPKLSVLRTKPEREKPFLVTNKKRFGRVRVRKWTVWDKLELCVKAKYTKLGNVRRDFNPSKITSTFDIVCKVYRLKGTVYCLVEYGLRRRGEWKQEDNALVCFLKDFFLKLSDGNLTGEKKIDVDPMKIFVGTVGDSDSEDEGASVPLRTMQDKFLVSCGPLPPAQIALPRLRSEMECPICYEKIQSADTGSCPGDYGKKHCFHANCLSKWKKINPSCPMCMVSLGDDDTRKAVGKAAQKIYRSLGLKLFRRFQFDERLLRTRVPDTRNGGVCHFWKSRKERRAAEVSWDVDYCNVPTWIFEIDNF